MIDKHSALVNFFLEENEVRPKIPSKSQISKLVAHARKSHIQWEKKNRIDPYHDWEK